MTAMDTPRYEAAYAEMLDCYGKRLSPDLLAQRDAWWRKLAPAYAIDVIEAAFESAPRYSKRFLPNIGNIIEALDAQQADKGGAAYASPTRYYQRTDELGHSITEAEYACGVCCDTRFRARVIATGEIVREVDLQQRRLLPNDDPQHLSTAAYRMGRCECQQRRSA